MKNSLLFLMLTFSLWAHAFEGKYGDLNLVKDSSLKDVAEYNPNPEVKALANEIISALKDQVYRTELLGGHISYLDEGPHTITRPKNPAKGPESEHEIVKESLENIIYGVEIFEVSENEKYDLIKFRLLVNDSKSPDKFVFKFFQFKRGQNLNLRNSLEPLIEVPLRLFAFDVEVGILQKKAIVTGTAQIGNQTMSIKKVYPVDVGALDNGGIPGNRYRSATPLYQNHTLDARKANPMRTDPWYFRAMPFLGVTISEELKQSIEDNFVKGAFKVRTGVGFHRPMTSKMIQVGKKKMKVARIRRGFDSHGCIRLPIPDLFEMHAMLTKSERRLMKLNIRHELSDPTDSNYPVFEVQNKKYSRTTYHTTQIQKVVGSRRVGQEVKVQGKVAMITGIEGQTVKYKTLDDYGLDNFSYVSTEELMSGLGINNEQDIMVPEQEAIDWLYMYK